MKIVCLAENYTSNQNLIARHGLSLYIETNGCKILFDMGDSDAFYNNALSLGINLKEVDFAVLSHGHYDHGGGLKTFLEINEKAPVFINPLAFGDYYNKDKKYIGLDKSLSENERIIFTNKPTKIAKDITVCTFFADDYNHLLEKPNLYEKVMNSFIEDKFLHENYLLITENDKTFVFSGCSHKGVLNAVSFFKPDFFIGGFHLSKLPLGESLITTAKLLDGFSCQYLTCHCTGKEQFEFIKPHIKNIKYLSCGDVVVL